MKHLQLLLGAACVATTLVAASPVPTPAPLKHELVVRTASLECIPGVVVALVPLDRAVQLGKWARVTDAAGISTLGPLLAQVPSGPLEIRVSLAGFVPVTLGPFVSASAIPEKLAVTLNLALGGEVVVCACP
jgi:hypothetical protein